LLTARTYEYFPAESFHGVVRTIYSRQNKTGRTIWNTAFYPMLAAEKSWIAQCGIAKLL